MNVRRAVKGIRPGVALLCLSLLGAIVVPSSDAQAKEFAFFNVGAGVNAVDTADFLPVGTIALPGTSLWGMAVCSQAQRLYAFDINTQTLNVVDPGLGRVVSSIPLPGLLFTPYGMAVNAQCTRLYFAADKWQNGLIEIDLTRELVMREFDIPYAHNVAVLPSGEKIYVTTKYGELYVLRASDLEILSVGDYQGAELSMNAAGTRVYIAGDRGNVAVLDTATDSLVGTVPVPFHVDHITVSGRWAYVGNKERGQLGILDLVDAHVEKVITLEVDRWVRVGGIDVTADGSRVVVLFDNDLKYKYAVVDAVSQTLLGVSAGPTRPLICNSRFIMDVRTPETTFAVNTTVDAVDANPGDGYCESEFGNGVCTLRAAVQEANATPGSSYVDLPAGTYVLTIPGMDEDLAASGDLDVLGSLTIRGVHMRQTIVDGNAMDRVFHVVRDGNLTLQKVMVQNGNLPYRAPGSFASEPGAGIYNASGVLKLLRAGVCRNKIEGFGGGGVDSRGTLYAEDSVFSNNLSRGWAPPDPDNFRFTWTLMQGPAAISATAGELKRCVAQLNLGSVAVRIGGPVSDSTISKNSSEGLSATVVTRCVVATNSGRGCTATTVVDSSVTGNLNNLPGAGGRGGGIFNDSGKLTVIRTTVSGNSANQGGGVYAKWLELVNSTVSGNRAREAGGGIFIQPYGEWGRIQHSTITGNIADSDANGSGDGGGLYYPGNVPVSYSTIIWNTLVAGNRDLGEEAPDCGGFFTSGRFNLFGVNRGCGFAASSWDLVGTADEPIDPLLGPLARNGGLTATHALLPGSPAIDAAHPSMFNPTDQRLMRRPTDGDGDGVKRADIGAFER